MLERIWSQMSSKDCLLSCACWSFEFNEQQSQMCLKSFKSLIHALSHSGTESQFLNEKMQLQNLCDHTVGFLVACGVSLATLLPNLEKAWPSLWFAGSFGWWFFQIWHALTSFQNFLQLQWTSLCQSKRKSLPFTGQQKPLQKNHQHSWEVHQTSPLSLAWARLDLAQAMTSWWQKVHRISKAAKPARPIAKMAACCLLAWWFLHPCLFSSCNFNLTHEIPTKNDCREAAQLSESPSLCTEEATHSQTVEAIGEASQRVGKCLSFIASPMRSPRPASHHTGRITKRHKR